MPHSDETFYKMKCGWADDPKVSALTRYGAVDTCLGRDLFGQMIDYARRELTDGLVPGGQLGKVAHPLSEPEALRVVANLADPGPFGPLIEWDAHRNAWRILAYARWNDTRAEVQARIEGGRHAALHRWKGTGADGNAGGNAARNAGRNADGIHRAPARVHTEQEQEQEQEQEAAASVVTEPSPARTREDEAAADVLDRIDSALVALALGGGKPVTREQAAAYRAAKLEGRTPRDPLAYVLGPVRKNPRLVAEHAAKADPHVTESRQPAPVRALCRRCSRTDHRTEDCPTAQQATSTDDRELVREEGGPAAARKLMANRERPARADQPAAPELHGEALARQQVALARAERGSAPRPPEPEEPEPEPDEREEPGDPEPHRDAEEEAAEYEVPF